MEPVVPAVLNWPEYRITGDEEEELEFVPLPEGAPEFYSGYDGILPGTGIHNNTNILPVVEAEQDILTQLEAAEVNGLHMGVLGL